MFEKNWKTTVILILLAVGLVFEGAKRLRPNLSDANSNQAQLQNLNYEPYARRANIADSGKTTNFDQHLKDQKGRPVSSGKSARFARAKIAKQDVQFNQHEFNHGPVVDVAAKTTAPKANKGKDKQIIKDKNTGEEYELDEKGNLVKLKKKKKKDGEEEEDEDKEDKEEALAKKDEDKEPVKPETPKTDLNAPLGVAQGGSPQSDEEKKNPELLNSEEWKRILLNQPDFKETNRFIQAYQSNLVTSATFYEIVDLMLADSRQQIREYGLMAVGSNPSFQSFSILAGVIQTEAFSSPLRTSADSYLKTYKQIRFLPILSNALSSPSNSTVVAIAAKLIGESATQYLGAAGTKTPPEGGPTSQSRTPSYASHFTGFISLLEVVSSNTSDGTAAQEARQTLETLRSLLT